MADTSAERALYQELRLALTINGGVSLAVWMGGVVSEIDRFRCAFAREPPDPTNRYAALLDALETLLVPDVIAGTSAGGMNGALLAYVIANGKSVDCAGEGRLSSTWQQVGSIERLLPTDGEPSSVLLGDEVLFRGCAEVFGALQAAPCDLNADASRWVRLTVTATDSHGYDVTTQGVTTPDHRLRMQFRHVERPSGSRMRLSPQLVLAIGKATGQPVTAGATEWPFPPRPSPRDLDDERAAAFLARAARSTASFPIAFTSSVIPLNHTLPPLSVDTESQFTATPPMEDIVETADPTSQLKPPGDHPASRYVIDGGVWDNSPFSAVLRGIDHMPAGRDVRRVLAYIVGTRASSPSQQPTEPPKLAPALLQAIALPADLSFANDLERIAEDRRRQSGRRESAPALLAAENVNPFALASGLYRLYRKRRLGDELAAMNEAVARTRPADPRDVPWLPPDVELPSRDSALADWWATSADWRWGIAPVRAPIQQARSMLRAVIRRLHARQNDVNAAALVGQLIDTRELLSQLTWALDDLSSMIERAQLQAPPGGDLASTGWSDAARNMCGQAMADFATSVAALNAPLRECLASLPANVYARALTTTVKMAVDLTEGGEEMIIKRALAIEIVLSALSESDAGHRIDYSLTAIRPDNEWLLPSEPGRSPLAGASYHHFGGFLRASWRVNDWMWGRLDGAKQIIRLLLDQAQLVRLCGSPPVQENITNLAGALAAAALADDDDDIARRVFEEACSARGLPPDAGEPAADRRAALATLFETDIARVLAAGEGTAINPAQRAAVARLQADLARRFQLAILEKEIPNLATASEKDGGPPVDIAQLLARRDNGLRELSPDPPGAALTRHEGHQLLEHSAANAAYGLGHPNIGRALRLVALTSGSPWAIRRVIRAARIYTSQRRKEPSRTTQSQPPGDPTAT